MKSAAELRADGRLRRRAGVAGMVAALTILAPGVSGEAGNGVPWLEDFMGEWRGAGRFGATAASYELSWEPALDGRFVRQSVRYSWSAPGGERRLHGEALYPARAQGHVRGDWFDSEGHRYATSAYRLDGSLVVHWGEAGTRGRSIYTLDGNRLSVEDSVWRDPGGWRVFSGAQLERQ